jgi:hypothetical protein
MAGLAAYFRRPPVRDGCQQPLIAGPEFPLGGEPVSILQNPTAMPSASLGDRA